MNVAVLGCGLIGGSAALAWRRAFPDSAVAGYDRDTAAIERAFAEGALTRLADSPEGAVAGADIVIVATPVGTVGEIAARIAPSLGAHTLVTDTGSVKGSVIAAVREAAPGISFIGGHPMAGTEQQGFAAASADLFAGAWWFLTPDDATTSGHAARLAPLLRAIGAKVVEVDPVEHDRIVAAISHLPMLMAATLVHLAGTPMAGEDARTFAGGGFRDMTRIADSNPQLWLEICLENRAAIIESLSALSAETQRLERSLFEEDRDGLTAFLTGARVARRLLPEKAERAALTVIAVEVPDRPGTLAAVSRILGEAGVNIEDIRVAHTPAGDKGWFFLTVASAELTKAVEALGSEGFDAEHLSR